MTKVTQVWVPNADQVWCMAQVSDGHLYEAKDHSYTKVTEDIRLLTVSVKIEETGEEIEVPRQSVHPVDPTHLDESLNNLTFLNNLHEVTSMWSTFSAYE
jgi:hypothetical protein